MNQLKTAWERVLLARHPKRPTSVDLIQYLFPDFIEFHGDRVFGDDAAIIGGIGTFQNQVMTVIAQEKGVTTEDKIRHNFGMPHPEGYRKAIRLMRQAEKFDRPILCIIDTPGAYPGITSEERGQARAIAYNLKEMMHIQVPIIVVVLGEGGSGGALAIGVGDKVFMFENSIYAILSPEGFASILYKDSSKANEAAEWMKLTAENLLNLQVIDEIIDEKEGLHENLEYGFSNLKSRLEQALGELVKLPKSELIKLRKAKYRNMGKYRQ